MIHVTISNRQKSLPVDRRRIRLAVTAIVREAGVAEAEIGVAIVGDAAIAALHQQFLNDPEPTDVLSFVLDRSQTRLEGEVIASAETAAASAPRYGLAAEDELLLYVIHGTLHLVGCDDRTPRQRAMMREQERKYLNQMTKNES